MKMRAPSSDRSSEVETKNFAALPHMLFNFFFYIRTSGSILVLFFRVVLKKRFYVQENVRRLPDRAFLKRMMDGHPLF